MMLLSGGARDGLFGDANLDSFTVDAHETPDSINILLDTLLFLTLSFVIVARRAL
jgi:hypothetical protein